MQLKLFGLIGQSAKFNFIEMSYVQAVSAALKNYGSATRHKNPPKMVVRAPPRTHYYVTHRKGGRRPFYYRRKKKE